MAGETCTAFPPKWWTQINGCNAKQAEVCRKVASQVVQEILSENPGVLEPLRWAVHGGPGTGKSYVLNRLRKELFEDILGWKQGDEFQVVTLQAVMANDLKGDTIHHAFGLNWQGLGDERISGHKVLELSAKALRWRWLIIDEISMVSAELLARLELRCRELVRDLAQGKYAKDAAYARPFGGLNVILAGDMWQLPPPLFGRCPIGMVDAMQNEESSPYHPRAGVSPKPRTESMAWQNWSSASVPKIYGCRVYKTKYETARCPRRTTHFCMAVPRPYLAAGTGTD